jgi:general secretion pathway protein H
MNLRCIKPERRAAHPPRRHEGGFTLLEIMIVVVIVGILISLATLSVGSIADDGLDEHLRRFETLFGLALEDAGMQGRELGLSFYQHGYEFSARTRVVDEEGNSRWVWVPIDNDMLLRPRKLNEDIAVDLSLEGNEIVLDYERDTEAEYIPQIFVLSSGDVMPPFSVRIRNAFANEGLTLSINELGEIETDTDDF